MKRFKFDLEEVLQLRKFREEECKLVLGQAIGVLNRIENEIKETAVKRHNAASQRFTDIGETAAWENYILRLDREAQKLAEKAVQAEIVVDEKRALYLEASRALKAVEELKGKKKKEHRKKTMDLQMAEIDDLTAARSFLNLE